MYSTPVRFGSVKLYRFKKPIDQTPIGGLHAITTFVKKNASNPGIVCNTFWKTGTVSSTFGKNNYPLMDNEMLVFDNTDTPDCDTLKRWPKDTEREYVSAMMEGAKQQQQVFNVKIGNLDNDFKVTVKRAGKGFHPIKRLTELTARLLG
jgi:hypothetical protein